MQNIDLFQYGSICNKEFIVLPDKVIDFCRIIKDYKLGLPSASRKNSIKYLEGILTCVNYSDYLRITLPINKQIFDNLVVVTHHKDLDTQNLCKEFGVEYVLTDSFYKNDATFNKGAAINVGISALNKKD
jgi:hypothetical protein